MPADSGLQVIHRKLTPQDLASRIGASHEMVSRILQDLVRGGYIEVENKRITFRKKLPSIW